MNKSTEQKTEHIIRRMISDRSIDAPADSVKYAKDLYRLRAVEPKTSMIQRVLAVLQLDLAPNRAAFGERSASASETRQLLFDAGDNAVDLRVTPVSNGFDIRGQILGEGFENGKIEITNKEKMIGSKIDSAGGFKITDVPAGQYSLTAIGSNTEIFVEQLILK